MSDTQNLKLSALDEDDLRVVSSLMQDSIIKAGEWLYDSHARSFSCLGLRFCHEKGQKPLRAPAVLRIDGVLMIRSKGLDSQKNSERVLSLLSIGFVKHPEPDCVPAGQIILQFAPAGQIAIYVECIDVLLMDRSAPRSARSKPQHKL